MVESAEFDFYDIVSVRNTPYASAHGLVGLTGAIVGKAVNEGKGRTNYLVHLYELDRTWYLFEEHLSWTGMKTTRDAFMSGETIRVNSRGQIVEP